MYTVAYSGPFGFIKPWTAVRDKLTYSQTFLTPSIIEGIRQKLEVEKVVRHKLKHSGIDIQMERTQSAGWSVKAGVARCAQSILERGVLLSPVLILAFETLADAEKAATQHLCLCRNEDVLLPHPEIREVSDQEFDNIPGVELLFGESEGSFLVGFNRFNDAQPMYGSISVVQDAE